MKLRNTISDKSSIVLFLAMFFLLLPTVSAAGEKIAFNYARDNILMSGAESAFQTNNPVVSNLQIPFAQTVFVSNGDSSEFVVFSGNIHLVASILIPTDPILPPNPIRIHTNVMNVSGTGQTSGSSYRLGGTANLEFPVNLPGSFSFGTSYRLLPPNPIRVLSLPVNYNVSLNSDGSVAGVEAFGGVIEE